MKKVFTSGQVAKICKVAPRTVSKWFDSGRLKGYRIPGSQDRRIPRENLLRFLKEHGMPTAELEASARFKVLLVGAAAPLAERLKEGLPAPAFQLVTTGSTFTAGLTANDLKPEAVVIDLSVGRSNGLAIAASLRQHEGLLDAFLIALASEDEAAPEQLRAGGFSVVIQKPISAEVLLDEIRARREELFDEPLPALTQAAH